MNRNSELLWREKAVELLQEITALELDEIEYKTNEELAEYVYGKGYAWNGSGFVRAAVPAVGDADRD